MERPTAVARGDSVAPGHAPEAPEPRGTTPSGEVRRIAGELGLGAASGVGGSGVGMLVGAAAYHNLGDGQSSAIAQGLLVGLAVGWTFAVPAGVAFVGRASGRDGTYGHAFLGSTVGMLLGGAVFFGTPREVGQSAAGAVTALALPVLGSVLAYELSCTRSGSRGAATEGAAGPSVTPSFNPGREGMLMGVTGSF